VSDLNAPVPLDELARHTGHADVIRESIDGATADRLGDEGAEPVG
jgi:hypothetical protein